jgi:surfeit locus 1 family protein
MTPVRRQFLLWLAASLAMALTLSLACWQLRRADQKMAAYAELLERQHQPPWRNADWPCSTSVAPASLPQQKPVSLAGQWQGDRTVFLDNRPMDGVSGFIVVTPLRLSASASTCPGRTVLVARGWVPRDPHDRLRLPAVNTPTGEVQVLGRVMAGLSQTYQLGAEPLALNRAGPLVRQNVDGAFWAGWLGQPPLVGAVLQVQADVTSSALADNLLRHWPEPGQGQEKHLAYAAQWFALSTLIAGLTLWFQIIRPRLRSHVHS